MSDEGISLKGLAIRCGGLSLSSDVEGATFVACEAGVSAAISSDSSGFFCYGNML